MIKFTQKGDLSKVTQYLERQRSSNRKKLLDKYGALGVEYLRDATPKDTGKTASSWSYSINSSKDKMSIEWSNSNVNKGVPIAIILQYGHGTGTGGYVQGRDYINPAIQSVFDEMSKELWEEMTRV